MATSSEIHYYDGNTLKTVYCHFDGYLEGVGSYLFEYYQEPNKVKELVNLGDLSYIGKEVSPSDPNHSFDTPQEGVTVAYHRDRGEELRVNESQFRSNDTSEILKRVYHKSNEGYNYLYLQKEKTWYYIDTYGEEVKLLSEALGKEEPSNKVNKKHKTFITRKKSVEIARPLRLNKEKYYGIVLNEEGKLTELFFKEEELNRIKGLIFWVNWEDFQKVIGQRPTQAKLAEYIYKRGNHEVFKILG